MQNRKKYFTNKIFLLRMKTLFMRLFSPGTLARANLRIFVCLQFEAMQFEKGEGDGGGGEGGSKKPLNRRQIGICLKGTVSRKLSPML